MAKRRKSKFSNDIVKNLNLMKVLSRASPGARREILKHSDRSLTKAICECTKNVISGRVPVSKRHFKKLKPHATHLRKLTDRATPLSGKTRVIQQHGGFLATLLSALLPVIIGGITSAIAK